MLPLLTPLESDSGGGIAVLLPALPELLAGIVLFGIIWFVAAKKVVPMFEATYAERTAEIAGGIEKAEAAQKEAAAALASYTEQLSGARAEAGHIREEAKAQAAAIAAEIRQQAQADSERMLASAKAAIEAERIAAMHQLRSEIGGLATELAGRIVGESLESEERAQRTVDRFIAELESQPEVSA
ncbi:ATP synthase F0 subcomplex B subunit [Propionicimonas paludicola]|uniref:ATP synthase subunit b n=1 Tax=Propionicimonas paludicola TaxID=185243 RepID=A0A2A9CQX1_9ACTN|nr:F0F1 ATP synthase subunit B [Propionicimonas paludicola]PFG16813.1 ATP synthase F0 subcomplex B subunit [Propionicimonas paludicola]